MPPESEHFLRQMLQHAQRIQKYVAVKTVTEFLDDELLIDGVGMNFVVIGEAFHKSRKPIHRRPSRFLSGIESSVFATNWFTDTARSMTKSSGTSFRINYRS